MKISLIVLLLVLMSACNNTENQPQNQSQNKTTAAQQLSQTDNNKAEAFDFSYKDMQGNEVKLSDYRGKWVVVNFWATWCPPCRKEIPDFVKFKSLYADEVEILGINSEDSELEKIQNFTQEYAINYPILLADVYNPSDFDRENTMGLPTTVIFNPQGLQASKRVGPMHFEELVSVMGLETKTIPQSSE